MQEEKLKTRAKTVLCSVPPEYKSKGCLKNADYLCHHCGVPLCDSCAEEFEDPEFTGYEASWGKFILSLILIIGSPILLPQYVPSQFYAWGAYGAILGVIVGLSVMAKTSIEPKFKPVTKFYQKAIHCKKCFSTHKLQKSIETALLIIGLLAIVLGGYYLTKSFDPSNLILFGIGYAYIVLKRDASQLIVKAMR